MPSWSSNRLTVAAQSANPVPVARQSSIRLTGLRPQPRLRRALITQVGGSSAVAEGEMWAGEIW